jgi:hypothetical protein
MQCDHKLGDAVVPPQVLPITQTLSKKLSGKKLPEQERRAGLSFLSSTGK